MYTRFYGKKLSKERFYLVYLGVYVKVILKYHKKIGCEFTDWIHVAGVGIQWPGTVNRAVIVPTAYMDGCF
jgi:hypothetical protein